jgi:hypothetical protein
VLRCPHMRATRRGLALLALTTACALPASAAATTARPVGQLPDSAGQRLTIESVSTDGARVLLTKAGSSPGVTLWTLDTTTGVSRQLAALPLWGRYSQSPAGDWAAWVTKPGARSCPRSVDVARTDGSEPPRRLVAPDAYARMAVNGLTVGAGGRVTVRVGPCEDGREPSDSRAILTADPGSTMLRVLAHSRSNYSDWPVSQDGRVFALCRRTKVAGLRAVAELTVVDSGAQLEVSRARLPYRYAPLGPACVASDAGTATMTALRRRPGVGEKAKLRDYRVAGVTARGDRSPRFELPYGVAIPNAGLEAASPSGDEVVTGFSTFGTTAIVIRTATGRHSRPFRTPTDGLYATPSSGGQFTLGQPMLPWDPFAPAIVAFGGQGRRGFAVRVINPHTLKTSRAATLPADPRADRTRACFLPPGGCSSRRGPRTRLRGCSSRTPLGPPSPGSTPPSSEPSRRSRATRPRPARCSRRRRAPAWSTR